MNGRTRKAEPPRPPGPAFSRPLRRLRHRLRVTPTQQLLLAHLYVSLVVAAVSVSVLLLSYHLVHRTPAQVRDSMAPSVQRVAATRVALKGAQAAAEESVRKGLTGVVGSGEEYRTQLSAADQNLSRLTAGGEGASQSALETVNGLLTVYSDVVAQSTGKYAHDPLMREQKLNEARSLLKRQKVGIIPRLDAFQRAQITAMRTRTSFGTLQTAGWAVAEVGLAVLALVLGSAWWVLRHRCGRRFSSWLAASMLLTVLLGVLPLWWTVTTQRHLDTARTQLAAMEQQTHPMEITDKASAVRGAMAATGPATARYPWLVAGCALLAVCPVAGLSLRLYTDYGRAAA